MFIFEIDLTKDLNHIVHYEAGVRCDDGLVTLVIHAKRWHDMSNTCLQHIEKNP